MWLKNNNLIQPTTSIHECTWTRSTGNLRFIVYCSIIKKVSKLKLQDVRVCTEPIYDYKYNLHRPA